MRRLASEHCENIIADRHMVILTDQSATERFLGESRPNGIFLAAGHVGGIFANDNYPADFIVDNLAIGLDVIRDAHRATAEVARRLEAHGVRLVAQDFPREGLAAAFAEFLANSGCTAK